MRYSTKSDLRRLGNYTQKIVAPTFKARGLIEGKIITHWSHIVGEKFSSLSLPEKIVFPRGKRAEGTLHLLVTSSGSLLLHAIQDLVLDKINTFFGYKAVAKLYMTHGLIPTKTTPVSKTCAPLSREMREWVINQTCKVEDVDLKERLTNLGTSLCERNI